MREVLLFKKSLCYSFISFEKKQLKGTEYCSLMQRIRLIFVLLCLPNKGSNYIFTVEEYFDEELALLKLTLMKITCCAT